MAESKWIKFVPIDTPNGMKTKLWNVMPKSGPGVLGTISWFGRWRKYTFNTWPSGGAIFEEDCLRDIANFIEEETKKH